MPSLIQYLSNYLGIPNAELVQSIEKAPRVYRRYKIPKKKKGEFRTIYHPSKVTKAIQSAAVRYLSGNDLVHECAAAYIPGLKSPLLKNARKHSRYYFTIRIDVKDFFPSITEHDFQYVFDTRKEFFGNEISQKEANLCKKLFFVKHSSRPMFLGIGAPSSPFLSNVVMYQMDSVFHTFSRENEGCYTRYADDLTFSSNQKQRCESFRDYVHEVFGKYRHPRLTVKEEKDYLSSRSSRRVVTGLVITPKGEVKVSRKTKRYIRKKCHDFKSGLIEPKEIPRLRGYLAYLFDVEQEYLNNLVIKYGASCIKDIFDTE